MLMKMRKKKWKKKEFSIHVIVCVYSLMKMRHMQKNF